MAGIPGKLINLKIGANELLCQADLTLNLTASTTDEEGCKPATGESMSVSEWVKRSVSTREWDASVSLKTIVSELLTNYSYVYLAKLFVSGSLEVTVVVETNSTSPDYKETGTFVFEGNAIMTGLTLNAPYEGASTVDVTFNSTEAPTFEAVAVVTVP